jgi:uncharacterized protein with NAD-binding domain and iron-sulfur cluster
MAAAFELTATPERRERFEVTVYQAGWRLGGKGASGRDRRSGQRVEEHGLHVWFGFYENAFDLMRRAYGELGADAPRQPWTDAFTSVTTLVLHDRGPEGWSATPVPLATDPLPTERRPPASLGDFLRDALRWFLLTWRRYVLAEAEPPDALREASQRAERGVETRGEYLEVGELLDTAAMETAASERRLAPSARAEPALFRQGLDFFGALVRGLVEDGALDIPPAFDEQALERLNEIEFRDWLRPRVRFPDTLEASFVRALYDLAFAYTDAEVPNLATGMTARNLFRILFEHRGSFMLKLRGGMGDVVFVPLYEVLRRRGVRFEFFHWVTCLRPSPDGRSVEAIEVVPQVRTRGRRYAPLISLRARGGKNGPPMRRKVWPSEPRWGQLEDGVAMSRASVDFERQANPLGATPSTLRHGKDFDAVVLGISLGGLPPICAELAAAHEPLARMLSEVPTVATQALQLWRTAPVPATEDWGPAIAGAYAKPWDTYCDMSHVLEEERWPRGHEVEHVAYFCGVLADATGVRKLLRRNCPPSSDPAHGASARDLAAATARVRKHARAFVEEAKPRPLETDALANRRGRPGGTVDDQYSRANVAPSERYVQSTAGSIKHRLSAEDSGFENLYLAGDWTRTPVDAGSVEAAVISGEQAAAALLRRMTAARRGHSVTATAPRYVEYGFLTTAPGPLRCRNTTLYGFWVKAGRVQLSRLCQAVFSEPSGGVVECHPILGHVLITFGVIGRIEPAPEPFDAMGHVTERQAAIWVPVLCQGPRGTPLAAVFVPFMWLDNPLSVASGREMYGYLKGWGWPRFAGDGTDGSRPGSGMADRFALDAYGIERYGQDHQPERRSLLEIDRSTARTAPGRAEEGTRMRDLGELASLSAETLGSTAETDRLGDLREAIESLLRAEVPQIFLKQSRSIADGLQASEQQITVAPARVDPERLSAEVLGAHELVVHDLDSHPLADRLGLAGGPVALAFRVDMDFTIESGRVLWDARTARSAQA